MTRQGQQLSMTRQRVTGAEKQAELVRDGREGEGRHQRERGVSPWCRGRLRRVERRVERVERQSARRCWGAGVGGEQKERER
jgi:hypothetical protein